MENTILKIDNLSLRREKPIIEKFYLSCSQCNQTVLYLEYFYTKVYTCFLYLESELFEILIEENNYLFIFHVEFWISNTFLDHLNFQLKFSQDIQ